MPLDELHAALAAALHEALTSDPRDPRLDLTVDDLQNAANLARGAESFNRFANAVEAAQVSAGDDAHNRVLSRDLLPEGVRVQCDQSIAAYEARVRSDAEQVGGAWDAGVAPARDTGKPDPALTFLGWVANLDPYANPDDGEVRVSDIIGSAREHLRAIDKTAPKI